MDAPDSNEPRPGDRGPESAPKLVLETKQPSGPATVKHHWREKRRDAAACLKTKNTGEPHYLGVLVPEGLQTGSKYWVCVGVREFKKGWRS